MGEYLSNTVFFQDIEVRERKQRRRADFGVIPCILGDCMKEAVQVLTECLDVRLFLLGLIFLFKNEAVKGIA
jgi:hypothetical protein